MANLDTKITTIITIEVILPPFLPITPINAFNPIAKKYIRYIRKSGKKRREESDSARQITIKNNTLGSSLTDITPINKWHQILKANLWAAKPSREYLPEIPAKTQ
jgi:hypothetical protein